MTLRSAALHGARLIAPLFGSRFARARISDLSLFLDALQGIGSGSVLTSRELFILFGGITEAVPVIFDVGAHTGQFLGAALERTSNCIVHAFEPAQVSFARLAEKFGHAGNVRLNRLALSDLSGSGILFYDEPGSQLASLTLRQRFATPLSEAVRLESLDQYCQSNGVTVIHLLKLDVEGMERHVLEGGSQMLERRAIRRIVFEFGGCHIDSRVFFRDIYDLLTGKDFKLFRLSPAGLYAIDRYSEALERFQTSNYLANLAAPDVYSS